MVYNNKEIGKLGFGLMRLPMIGTEIDVQQTQDMVDMCMEHGFTYFDTSYIYLDQRSEPLAKKILVDRYPRDSFQLATKLPAWAGAKSKEEAQQMFFTSLERTGCSYFDFYLLHNIGAERTQLFEDWDLWDFVFQQKALGKIKQVGFSIHDNADALEAVLIKHPEVDFVQLQINYADWENTSVQSRRCYEVAKQYGKPIVVMEPVRGGTLANPPEQVKAILNEANPHMSYATWALKFVAGKDNIITVLSGMSNLEQVQENVRTMEAFTPLSKEEDAAIVKAQQALQAIPSIPCTNCQYCVKDCPQSIKIPTIMGILNKQYVYNDTAGAQRSFAVDIKSTVGLPSACIGCRKCEKACPQNIAIVAELKKAADLFEK